MNGSRRRFILLAVMTAWLLGLLVVRAREKPLWHDEVYTVLTADLPLASLWRANLEGVDLAPPLNTALTHVAQTIGGPGRIVSRLPAMAGFLSATLLLYLTVSRRTSAIVGVFAVLWLCATPAWDYAIEARGYGLSVGCFALALSAWTEAIAGRRPTFHWIVMAAALAAGVWTHYFTVLAAVPIVMGELVRQRGLTKFHAAPWMALAGAALGALPLETLMAAAAAHRTTFWAQIGEQTVGDAYMFVLKDLPTHTWVIAGLVALVIVQLWHRFGNNPPAGTRHLAAHDIAACLGCLAIPALAFLMGESTHVFTTRYLVFATVGVAFAGPLLLWRVLPENGAGEWLAAAVLAWPLLTLTVDVVSRGRTPIEPLNDHPLLADWIKAPDPIVLTGGVDYLNLWYSLPPSGRPLAMYLADPEAQRQAEGTDTVDSGYLALARWTSVPVVPMRAFVQTHRHFWIYATGRDWVIPPLRAMGATLTEHHREVTGVGTLYEVTLPPDAGGSDRR